MENVAPLSAAVARLAPCPSKPNCVGSQASGRNFIPPLVFSDSAQNAFERLRAIVASLPRTRIVEQTSDYLHAEAASRIFGFIDDVEFYIDQPGKRVQVRSAARLGYSDFGVNRARIEAIRARFSSDVHESAQVRR
jgi:uncharacterized protein (DUF1499 family)